MAENISNISFIVSQLPNKLQKRFESLGNYVRGLIDEESSRLNTKIVLSTEDIQLIQLAGLIYSLDSFFRAGSSSARSAATIFEEFELSGFQVGSTTFTKENINTRRGDLLADRLSESIRNSALGEVIRNSNSMRELISTMILGMNNG
jgi:hypothetical protein